LRINISVKFVHARASETEVFMAMACNTSANSVTAQIALKFEQSKAKNVRLYL